MGGEACLQSSESQINLELVLLLRPRAYAAEHHRGGVAQGRLRYTRCGRRGTRRRGERGLTVASCDARQVSSVDLSLTRWRKHTVGRLPFVTALSMKFRPCIDLHSGAVKQIVGSSLKDGEQPRTNFVSELPSTHYAELYRKGNAADTCCLVFPDAE